MPSFVIQVNIPAEKWIKVYQGIAKQVVCRTLSGQKVQLSAKHLQSFVTHSGVQGVFELETDETFKFLSIKRRN